MAQQGRFSVSFRSPVAQLSWMRNWSGGYQPSSASLFPLYRQWSISVEVWHLLKQVHANHNVWIMIILNQALIFRVLLLSWQIDISSHELAALAACCLTGNLSYLTLLTFPQKNRLVVSQPCFFTCGYLPWSLSDSAQLDKIEIIIKEKLSCCTPKHHCGRNYISPSISHSYMRYITDRLYLTFPRRFLASV